MTWAMLSQLPVCQLAAQLAVPATPSRKLPARVALARKPMSHTAYTAVDDMLKGRISGMAARSGIAGWAAEAVLGINKQQRGTGLCQGPARQFQWQVVQDGVLGSSAMRPAMQRCAC